MVREALKLGIEPEVIPGVSSLTFAMAASGLPSDHFAFYGFLPVKSGRRQKVLEEIRDWGRSAVIFESPYRVEKTLRAISEVIGPDTAVALVREATKLHEEILRGTAAELLGLGRSSWKGEFVIVVNPGNEGNYPNNEEENL